MKTEHITGLFFTLAAGYLFYIIMLPFLVPVFWGIVFVILFYPYYLRLLKYFRNEARASFLACFTIALFFIVPMAIVGTALADEVLRLYQWAENYIKEISTRAHGSPVFIFPHMQKFLNRYMDVSALDIQNFAAGIIKDASEYLSASLRGAVRSFAEFVLNLVLAFFTMYFLFKDGQSLLDALKSLIPVSDGDKEKILARNRTVITATFTGGVSVGAAQGVLGGLGFWSLGLSSPILWGFMMFIMSFLPSIGTALIWAPAAVYLFLSGHYIKGIILLVWGLFIVGLADNILRPMIVSGKTNQHPLLLFFSIIGAVNAFGLVGIIAGPIILAVAQSVVEIYQGSLKRPADG